MILVQNIIVHHFFFAHTSYLLNDPLLYTCVVNKMGLYTWSGPWSYFTFALVKIMLLSWWVFVYEISWEEKPTYTQSYMYVPLVCRGPLPTTKSFKIGQFWGTHNWGYFLKNWPINLTKKFLEKFFNGPQQQQKSIYYSNHLSSPLLAEFQNGTENRNEWFCLSHS